MTLASEDSEAMELLDNGLSWPSLDFSECVDSVGLYKQGAKLDSARPSPWSSLFSSSPILFMRS